MALPVAQEVGSPGSAEAEGVLPDSSRNSMIGMAVSLGIITEERAVSLHGEILKLPGHSDLAEALLVALEIFNRGGKALIDHNGRFIADGEFQEGYRETVLGGLKSLLGQIQEVRARFKIGIEVYQGHKVSDEVRAQNRYDLENEGIRSFLGDLQDTYGENDPFLGANTFAISVFNQAVEILQREIRGIGRGLN